LSGTVRLTPFFLGGPLSCGATRRGFTVPLGRTSTLWGSAFFLLHRFWARGLAFCSPTRSTVACVLAAAHICPVLGLPPLSGVLMSPFQRTEGLPTKKGSQAATWRRTRRSFDWGAGELALPRCCRCVLGVILDGARICRNSPRTTPRDEPPR